MRAASTQSPVVLVLASGRGERFVASGGKGSKLQALLAGKPVLEHTLAAVRASGLPFHVEDAGHPGMGDSIAAAVRATRDAGGWLVLPGDLPLVRAETLRAVARSLANCEVVVPVHDGQRGHPVGFSAACGEALASLAGPRGAASIVQSRAARELPVPDEGILMDVDTVQALADAERMLAARAKPASMPACAVQLHAIGLSGDVDLRGLQLPPDMRQHCQANAQLYKAAGFVPPWIGYVAVSDGEPVGLGAFKAAPLEGRVEIAYFTLPALEGRGIATAIARELVRLARAAQPGIAVAAQTLPAHGASCAVLRRLGFEFFGAVQHPEDGQVWEWRLAHGTGVAP